MKSGQRSKPSQKWPATNIPNTFQHPNSFVEVLLPLLTGDETKILNVCCRKILGWDEHRATLRDRVSFSQFESLSGLSRGRVSQALRALATFNILKATASGLSERRLEMEEGREYELNLDQLGPIDVAAMRDRASRSLAAGRERMAKAHAVRAANHPERSGGLTDVGQADRPTSVRRANTQNPVKPTKTKEGAGAPSGAAPAAAAQAGPAADLPGQLATAFEAISGINLPAQGTKAQRQDFRVRWSDPLSEILELCGSDFAVTESLMRRAVDDMRARGLRLSSPKSILEVGRSLQAEGRAGAPAHVQARKPAHGQSSKQMRSADYREQHARQLRELDAQQRKQP